MNTGILTYHHTANYGAALQAYATQAALTGLGACAEIIDYTNPARRAIYSIRHRMLQQLARHQTLAAAKTLLGAPLILMRQWRFHDFYARHLRTGATVYTSPEQIREKPPPYDLYLAGSDQIWNCHHNGGDLNYLLEFVPDASRTASYASSFGLTTIPDVLKDAYARLLGRIRVISVREPQGADLVARLTGRRPPVVLDPVLLLPPGDWSRLLDATPAVSDPYVVIYTARAGDIRRFHQQTGYPLAPRRVYDFSTDVPFSTLWQPHIRVRAAAGPATFLRFIRDADLVLTTSFHGTALAILMQRRFITFLSGDAGKDARITGLLEPLGLMHRLFSAATTRAMVDAPVDYTPVNTRLDRLRADSLAFLDALVHHD